MENEEDFFFVEGEGGERAVSAAPSPGVPRNGKVTDCRQWIAKGSCSNGRRIVLSGIKSNERGGVPEREREAMSSSHETEVGRLGPGGG